MAAGQTVLVGLAHRTLLGYSWDSILSKQIQLRSKRLLASHFALPVEWIGAPNLTWHSSPEYDPLKSCLWGGGPNVSRVAVLPDPGCGRTLSSGRLGCCW